MPEINRQGPPAGARRVLHRSLDIQGHAELVQGRPEPGADSLGASTNETYQDENGQHLWSLKRFPGVSPESSIDNNPEEVE